MGEPKAFASLSSGLLARKGAARPAMRPQGFGQGLQRDRRRLRGDGVPMQGILQGIPYLRWHGMRWGLPPGQRELVQQDSDEADTRSGRPAQGGQGGYLAFGLPDYGGQGPGDRVSSRQS